MWEGARGEVCAELILSPVLLPQLSAPLAPQPNVSEAAFRPDWAVSQHTQCRLMDWGSPAGTELGPPGCVPSSWRLRPDPPPCSA